MNIYQKRPINAEPPESLLTQSWITPNDLWFKRNHHPIPAINEQDYSLTVNIPLAFAKPSTKSSHASTSTSSLSTDDIHDYLSNNITSKKYTLQDLKTKFPTHTLVVSIQCGGNRRMGMNEEGLKIGNNATLG